MSNKLSSAGGPPARRRGIGNGKMPVADDPLWKDWLTAEKTLGEARDQLRTVEHLDLGHREFQEAWQAYGSLWMSLMR